MKIFFLTGSILFTVFILILAFENIALSVNGFLFIFVPIDNPFFIVMSTAGIGVFAGMFYAALVSSVLNSRDEEEEEPGGESLEG